MSAAMEPWTPADVELYHDGEMPAERRERLTVALRRDAGLRAVLAATQRTDELVRAALEMRTAAGPRRVGLVFRLVPVVSAAAAVLLVAVTLRQLGGTAGRPGRSTPTGAAARVVEAGGYDAVRVVCSIPMRPRPAPEPNDVVKMAVRRAPAVEADAGVDVAAAAWARWFERELREGRVEGALRLLSEAGDEQREWAYRRMGEVLASGATAQSVLDQLSPQQQLAACAQWAERSTLQPVVFAQLRRLTRNPEVSSSVYTLCEQWLTSPRLRTWVVGYQLDKVRG